MQAPQMSANTHTLNRTWEPAGGLAGGSFAAGRGAGCLGADLVTCTGARSTYLNMPYTL